jgi:cytochrome c peroxidase
LVLGEPLANSGISAAVGELIFFDTSLSTPPGQACASCHRVGDAFSDASKRPTSPGAVTGRTGHRNAPTAMYAAFSPPFHYDAVEQGFVGGQFWDGRAATLEDQAKGPPLNPVEMNNAGAGEVVAKIRRAPYRSVFEAAFGEGSLDDPGKAYDLVAKAVADFERTPMFSPFSSRYDAYLAGRAQLSPAEARGLALFEDPKKGNCASCHPSQPSGGVPPLFTDFTYDNLGVPARAGEPLDRGLGGALGDPTYDGMFKVPTLRNVARTGPYTHAGYFADLKSLVHFYNTRDTATWPPPEVPATVNRDELGHLGLTDAEEDDIVAFLRALNDD